MRRPAGGRAWRAPVAAALLAGLAAAPVGAHPRLLLSGGRTFAIIANSTEGGPSFDLRALWPMRSDIGLGAALFAHDMGQAVGELPLDMGAVGEPAEFTAGAGLAADLHPFANRAGPARGLFANGTAALLAGRAGLEPGRRLAHAARRPRDRRRFRPVPPRVQRSARSLHVGRARMVVALRR